MELNLQPRSAACCVSGRAFAEGERVVSFLVRRPDGEVLRADALESDAPRYQPDGFVICRWTRVFKPRPAGENPERELKLTAEALFISLADPAAEPTAEAIRLTRFLALMLERKRLLRNRGRTPDGTKDRYEHARTKDMYEVPSGELTPEFFMAVHEQLSVLVGEPKAATGAPPGSSGAVSDAPAATH
jgi:hypothetical protein